MIQDSILFCTTAPLLLGFVSAWSTRSAVKSKWYKSIKKPWYNPPRYVFAPIWIYLYISTGYALYLVRNQLLRFSKQDTPQLTTIANWGVYCFWGQLFTNFLWSRLYFVKKKIELALVDMIILSSLAIITMVCFFSVNTLAGMLMIPYVAWALFATKLTYEVKRLNPNFKEGSDYK